jgi:uncharacterized iron-regulated protein
MPRSNHRLITILLALAVVFLPAAESLAHYMAYVVDNRSIILMETLAARSGTVDIVFIGEDHTSKEHHAAQLKVIKALKDSGAKIAVGLEMFRADRQEALDRWIGGEMSPEDFEEVYSEYWTLPWELYEDIFLYSREQGIPMIGLNVSKEITTKVARDGFASLTKEDLKQLPLAISCDVDEEYIKFIRRAHKAHGRKGKKFLNFCEAQLIWDKVMAWYIVDYLDKNPGTTVVVLAGKTHAWKKGIPEQVKKQSDLTYKVIFPLKPYNTPDLINTEYVDYLINYY